MYSIKGFASIPALASNLANTTASVGELSPAAATFSRDVTTHVNVPLDDVEFKSFYCWSLSSGRIATPNNYGVNIATILNWIYAEAVAGTLANNSTTAATQIATHFTSLSGVTAGPIVSGGSFSVPEWISWTQTTAGLESQVKVWLTDSAFKGQFDEFEIIIVPPITPIDNFFSSYSAVGAYLAAATSAGLVASITTASGNVPYTTLQTVAYDWVNPNNSAQHRPTEFTAIIYGNAGLSLDKIKQATAAYLLSHSTHTETEWKAIFPSVFISTEFIITPHWDKIGIPNQTLVQGTFSAIVTPQQITDHALITKGTYTENYVRSTVQGSFSTYRSVAFSIVGNVENIDGIYTFSGKFPDYLPVATTSLDFGRMSISTQQWTTILNDLLFVADTATEFSSLPAGMSRIYRNNIMFIGKSFNNVLYLVMAKAYYN